MMLLTVALLAALASPANDSVFVRVNQIGYQPDAPKVAVVCALKPTRVERFSVIDASGKAVTTRRAVRAEPFAACANTYRLDFSSVRSPGTYHVDVQGVRSPSFRIAATAYAATADTMLFYMRQQRSGYNPTFRTFVHSLDAIIVDDSARGGEFIPVTGGWADASDYLQYVTTSANAVFVMLMAYRDHPEAFGDEFLATGDPGRNGIPDVLDEARHGLEWLLRMYPSDTEMYNQLGDDRDHAFADLPPTDSSEYGWGKGQQRPVYPCTGKPQGIVRSKNRADGYASTAGKYAAAFAVAAQVYEERDSALANTFARKAAAAYELGKRYPGACQTAPGGSPYFYEEDNWTDDMELGAAELHALTGERRYIADAMAFAEREPVTPWMGADTARHYQWYPWHNNGHYAIWRTGTNAQKRIVAEYYRRGIEAVVARADSNGFRVGIPFIWCSSNLMVSFATQAYLYRQMTGDQRFREYEQAALDWIFGANPWGVSMVIGLPAGGVFARDPHAVVTKQTGLVLTGGLLDGPVYSSIYRNLRGIHLHEPDEFAAFNTGHIVYHDDYGDYSTNEPIMDGTANLVYLLAALGGERPVTRQVGGQ